MKEKFELETLRVGILGMTFKGNVDDFRSSLSFRLKKYLESECKQVMCSDPFQYKDYFVSTETILEESDIIIIGAAHSVYQEIKTDKVLIDIWNVTKNKSIL